MSAIEILILISYGGKIYILSPSEKKWLHFTKKKKMVIASAFSSFSYMKGKKSM